MHRSRVQIQRAYDTSSSTPETMLLSDLFRLSNLKNIHGEGDVGIAVINVRLSKLRRARVAGAQVAEDNPEAGLIIPYGA